MTFAAGRGIVFRCRALPELQRPHYLHPSLLFFDQAFVPKSSKGKKCSDHDV
jgi:hypothetical protein